MGNAIAQRRAYVTLLKEFCPLFVSQMSMMPSVLSLACPFYFVYSANVGLDKDLFTLDLYNHGLFMLSFI